jgi:hypothetical protein
MQDLVDQHVPQTTLISAVRDQVMLDNPNSHTLAVLHAIFPPAVACQIQGKFGLLLHAQAWQLVIYGGPRMRDCLAPMLRTDTSATGRRFAAR